MDNLTHTLVGLTAAKAGLERLSPGTTVLCVLAANAPDVDVAILLFGDRWTYLHHHRGITHAIAGVIFLALVVPLIFYGIDRLWARFRHQPGKTNLRGLMLASVIVTATHPLLDWTNNYGIRPYLPWSGEWYYGDLVFIIDPYLWFMLGGASFLLSAKTKSGKVIWATLAIVLTVLMIVSRRAGGLPNPMLFVVAWVVSITGLIVLFMLGAGRRWGTKIAFAAIGLVLLYWSGLSFAHTQALAQGFDEAKRIVSPTGESVRRLAAMPTLANPFRWDCVFETERATYRFNLGLVSDNNASPRVIRYEKPSGALAEAMDQVSQQRPAQIFLGFARYPVARLADPHCTTQTLVQFADLRYTEPGSSRGTFTLNLPVECPTSDEGGK